MPEESRPTRRWGWMSDVPAFASAEPRVVRLSLEDFVRDAGPEQSRAWRDSIPWLQDECRELVRCDDHARTYTAILEYELPRESRRPDVILLENGAIVVLELKGKFEPTQADIDQISAYARDLRCYHAECAERPVIPILVPTRADSVLREIDGVRVAGPHGLHRLLLECTRDILAPPLTAEAFLRQDAYAPLPSLVRAARDLFAREPLPSIKRARAATDPAVDRIARIAHEAAATATRRLILLTGVPGSGKTLVGLRLAHAGFLDDLSVARGGSKPTAPAVFLSGNGPLVAVLQDALKDAGGGGKVFVRGVKDYVRQYSRPSAPVPPEHLLVFDEAQRAWDAPHVARKHGVRADLAKSEPELFIEFAERIPSWCVVVGLIGTGQEIHTGEFGGLAQWRRAVERSARRDAWTIHAPAEVEAQLAGVVATQWEPTLNLNTSLRFHAAASMHEFADAALRDADAATVRPLGDRLWSETHRMLLTRDIESARGYLRTRFEGDDRARYGVVASSKGGTAELQRLGIDAEYHALRGREGRWYNAPPSDPYSCCRMDRAATEFTAQGLELDGALLAWGCDFLREGGAWSSRLSGKTRFVDDITSLRRNVYRVLLTRGREGTVIFVPARAEYDETARHLLDAGVRPLL